MRDYISLANLLTTGNLAAGFFALVLVSRSGMLIATLLVLAAAIFDALDGKLARERLDADTFGASLDSLADLVSFGAVPAFALYLVGLEAVPVLGIVACLLFLVCGAWRLARFSAVKSDGVFLGLPIPPAGIAAMLLVLAVAGGAPPMLAAAGAIALAALMVSSLRVPTLAGLRRRAD